MTPLPAGLGDTFDDDCRSCSGSGDAPCPRCRARGYQVVYMDGETLHETCRECGGVREIVCPECQGTGSRHPQRGT